METIEAPDLASPRFKANPYPFYARLRAEAPAYRIRMANLRTWLVTRYDDVLMVLRDERFANDWSPRMPWVLRRFAGPLTRRDTALLLKAAPLKSGSSAPRIRRALLPAYPKGYSGRAKVSYRG